MMIVYALLGLVAIVIVLGLVKWPKLAITLLIPLAVGLWFTVQTKIPDWLGYPLPIEFVSEDDQMLVLWGAQNGMGPGAKIYLLTVVIGETTPRLLELPPSEENQETLKKFQKKKSQGGSMIIRRGEGEKGKAGKGQSQGGVSEVPLEEQDDGLPEKSQD